MKKILLFLLLFISAITFSGTLENISYSNGKIIGTFKENSQIMPSASITKDYFLVFCIFKLFLFNIYKKMTISKN